MSQLERNNQALLNQLDVLQMFHTSTIQMQNQLMLPPGLSKVQEQLEKVHHDVESLWKQPSKPPPFSMEHTPISSAPRSYQQEQFNVDQALRRRQMDYHFQEKANASNVEELDVFGPPLSTASGHAPTYPHNPSSMWYRPGYWKSKYATTSD